MSDKIKELEKTCGLSIIPQVDLTEPKCSHFHSTECIIEDSELPYLNLLKATQKEINLKVDDNIGDFRNELDILNDFNSKNVIRYDSFKLKTTLLTKLFTNPVVIIDNESNVIPKYIEVKSIGSFQNVLTIGSDLELVAFNKENEMVYSVDVAIISKIKRLEIYKNIDIPNQWDDVTKIVLQSKYGMVVHSELNLSIKLYYNIE